MIYFGATKDVPAYFSSIGHEIPEGYNPADFLIDVLFLQCSCDGTTSAAMPSNTLVDEEEKEATREYATPEKIVTPPKKTASGNKKKKGSDEIELVRHRTSPALAEAQEQQKQQQPPGSPLRLAPTSPPRIVRLDILEAKIPSRNNSSRWVRDNRYMYGHGEKLQSNINNGVFTKHTTATDRVFLS